MRVTTLISMHLSKIIIIFSMFVALSGCSASGGSDGDDEVADDKSRVEIWPAYFKREKKSGSDYMWLVSPRILRNESAETLENSKYKSLMVNFATNRKPESIDGVTGYGPEPGSMSYGHCVVSIPNTHKIGRTETPSILRFEVKQNPEKHIVVLSTLTVSKEQFFHDLKFQTNAGVNNAFVFVHGYNVSFSDAARRTAQMAYDLNFKGTPVFFSWPSQASEQAYMVDERNIEWSEPDIKSFLTDFLKASTSENVYLIGHSMGTRGLTKVLASMASQEPSLFKKLKGIILAAPDIDSVIFKRDIAPNIIGLGAKVTLYASSNDKALGLSKMAHGYLRAGESGPDIVVMKGMDTIDASNVDTSFVGHSYFSDNRSIISDMHYLLGSGLPVTERAGLTSAGNPPDTYWLFRP